MTMHGDDFNNLQKGIRSSGKWTVEVWSLSQTLNSKTPASGSSEMRAAVDLMHAIPKSQWSVCIIRLT